jgi:hypothetical protein
MTNTNQKYHEITYLYIYFCTIILFGTTAIQELKNEKKALKKMLELRDNQEIETLKNKNQK